MVVLGVLMVLQMAGMAWGLVTDTYTGWFVRYILSGGNMDEIRPRDFFVGYEFFPPLILVKLVAHFLFDASVLGIVLLCGLPIIRRRESPQFYFLWKWFVILIKITIMFLIGTLAFFYYEFIPYNGSFVVLLIAHVVAIMLLLFVLFGLHGDILQLNKIDYWAKG